MNRASRLEALECARRGKAGPFLITHLYSHYDEEGQTCSPIVVGAKDWKRWQDLIKKEGLGPWYMTRGEVLAFLGRANE